MHPFISHDMIRQVGEERRIESLKVFSLRFEPSSTNHPSSTGEADLIEVVFGTQCEVEDAIA